MGLVRTRRMAGPAIGPLGLQNGLKKQESPAIPQRRRMDGTRDPRCPWLPQTGTFEKAGMGSPVHGAQPRFVDGNLRQNGGSGL
jgi:hypothetical protein